MYKARISFAVFVLSLGVSTAVVAETTDAIEPVAVSTVPVIVEPVAIATAPVVPVTQAYVPVTLPVDPNRNHDMVAWNKLDGTVQSVDRANRLMTVQDAEGKNVRVAFNDRIRIYRSGQQVSYSDVSPNDHIVLRYTQGSANQTIN